MLSECVLPHCLEGYVCDACCGDCGHHSQRRRKAEADRVWLGDCQGVQISRGDVRRWKY